MRSAPPTPRQSVLTPARKPGISLALLELCIALLYGVAIGALIASALWWWLS
jgi:hypothetical protein